MQWVQNLTLTQWLSLPFHPGTPQHVSRSGHYDITMGERDRALTLGARSITPQEDESRG